VIYVLQNTETGKYVARSGSANSYTSRLEAARVFHSREEAERDRCPESECIISVSVLLK
jgi:hypothetical protein